MRVLRLFSFLLAILLLAPSATLAQSGSYGTAVVLDGNELLVGEPNTSFREGSVYVYAHEGGSWTLVQRLTAPDAAREDGFGTVLAKDGDTLLAGQKNGPLHVFTKGTDGWQHAGTLTGNGTAGLDPGCQQYGYCGTDFGITLALEGDWLLIGAPGERPARSRGDEAPPARPQGVVHAYRKAADGSWTEQATIRSAAAVDGDRFGETILLTGTHALIGAPDWSDTAAGMEIVGRVAEFELQNGTWVETGALPFFSEAAASFGSALSLHGNELLVGAPGADRSRGAVYAYAHGADGMWAPTRVLKLPDGEMGDLFGTDVRHVGDDIWVGAPTLRENLTGATYVFPGGAAGATPLRLELTQTVERDAFGSDIHTDGNHVIVSAPGMHHQSGALFAYAADAPDSAPERLVGPPDALGALLGEKRDCVDGKIGPFDCSEVELLSFVPNSILRAPENARGVRTNDNWGWTDPVTKREYALVGRNDGTSFIDITDPSNPVLIGDLPKPWGTPPSQLWRDIKTYKDHAFIVADGAGDHGMQVFDLTRLRTVTNPPELFEPDLHYTDIASSHNVIINEESGFAYTVDGPTCGGGLYMMDINDPLNPVFVGCSKGGDRGTHDSQCVNYRGPDQRYAGREICLNSNGGYFEIMDVTDKANPVALSTASSPNAAYIHQGWLTDDHRYFYQDDESDVVRGNVPTTRTLIWDLTDLEDPILVKEFMGSMPASAHNLYLKDGMAYQANYRYGMHVLDISDPENPVEAGYFDTAPYMDGPGFSGAWSTYPFFESGTVIVTSLREGLFVLRAKKKES